MGGLGRAPVVPRSPITGSEEDPGRLVRQLKIPEVLKFVATSVPMSSLFAIIAEIRRLLVSYKVSYLPELNTKNFSGFSFR